MRLLNPPDDRLISFLQWSTMFVVANLVPEDPQHKLEHNLHAKTTTHLLATADSPSGSCSGTLRQRG